MVETATEEDVFWTYQDVAIFLGLAFPSLLGGAFVAKGLFSIFHLHLTHKALELLPAQFLGYALLFTALALLLKHQYRRPFWRSLHWTWPAIPPPLITTMGVALAFAIALLGAALKTPDTDNPMKELLADRSSLVAVMLFGVTLGPMCEELAFRGFMQPLFIRTFRTIPGIFLAAIAFGLLHLPQYGLSWRHGLLITLAGAAFGWMRWKTGSTLASTIMHAAYNLTLFLGFLASGKEVPKAW